MSAFPTEFVRNMGDIFGQQGHEWLATLPALVNQLAHEWRFKNSRMLPNLTYSYVAEVEHGGMPAILKLAPSCGRTAGEIAWYECNPAGTPGLFRSDSRRGAYLMEKLAPGHSLKKLIAEGSDEAATLAMARAILALQPVAHPTHRFKHVAELAEDLDDLEGKLSPQLLARARAIFKEHTSDRSRDLPLHGDIHHDNILACGTGWRVIDPHGYLGPRGFEVGCMFRNPYDCFPRHAPLGAIIQRRVEILCANLPFPREEILAWGFAYTLMAVGWSVSDHGELPEEPVAIAKVLLELH